jgi:hypothetical protein
MTRNTFGPPSLNPEIYTPQAPLLRQLAFQELAAIAQPPFAPRRAGLWADDSGGTWRAAVAPCLQQVLHQQHLGPVHGIR